MEECKIKVNNPDKVHKTNIAKTSLMTKLHPNIANLLIDILVEASNIITIEG